MAQHPEVTELIEKSKLGDHEAFRQLVLLYQRMVFGLAFRLLCDENDARDAVQEVFVKVWQQLHKYHSDYKFTTWLYKIATNCCYDILRSRKRKKYVSIDDVRKIQQLAVGDTSADYVNKNLSEIIIGLTNDLTPKQKLVFTLKELEGFEVEEIVAITGLSSEKIKSNLYLAKKSIRTRLDKLI